MDTGAETDASMIAGRAKQSIRDFALFGGERMFAEPLHVGRPNIGDRARLMARINDLLDRRWLTNHGFYVREFEKELAVRTGAGHCIAVCNATIGLEMAIRALGLHGEVIVPSFTFVATAHALQWSGVTPVFCDVDPQTHMLDPARVEELITPRTTGILAVHLWGRICETAALEDIARRRGLKLLFDAAHAFACGRGGRPVGTFGAAEVFSFHATKFVNSFEGGAVTTNDDALAERIRLMVNFGFVGYDDVAQLGTNGKMSEPAAAMGLTSLESMEVFVAANRRNQESYAAGLRGVPGVRLLECDATAEVSNYQYVVVEVDAQAARFSRDTLVQLLWAENVYARRYFFPGCHRVEPYRTLYPDVGVLLPETERLSERVLVLPTGTAVGAGEVAAVCALIQLAAANGSEVTAWVRALHAA